MARQGRRASQAITIQTVADHAGVSAMTVSNVLNHRATVREETRARVMAAISELNYTPNLAARSLAGAATMRIGLLHRNIENAFLSSILVGALDATSQMGAQLLLRRLEGPDPIEIGRQMQALVDNGANAILIAPPYCEIASRHGLTRQCPVPVVAISPGDDLPGENCVRIDDRSAAREMTAYLIGLGHRDIGFIRGGPGHLIHRTRCDGYIDALRDAGLDIRPELVVTGDMSFDSGLTAGEQLLGMQDRPTAIFASNDDMAAAIISLAHRRGLDVPRDLSVAGFDDTPIAVKIWPSLTTVQHPGAKISAEAATKAIMLARDGELSGAGSTIYSPSQLVIRESTSRWP
ncbi:MULTISPECIES: LacI family DNA-binding transcriptional regulator [unclassified Sphingobium]|uniref:LacI family DNA-binding transcriptional regulator n=1 Tax=unclassified Sphingobium TaxID=2611147 RepID=UPI000D17D0B8|nr:MULTISPECIES: LacI family DNA-binding transcriptional regulator [unclassified Sphingobium]MBG6117392.1 LacI family transcriptional regulator [Sphingobium sp. JAI105]PSO09606.1 LacI family transcriptional regulator [Sphingobium sp. AEW4]TWC96693.1 LacI family transcriptional regulator [Sphingobium sp. AEW010]TWD16443.1 LacI family transcriptional regulator [Sphingobium sp. AEW013]TWD19767.1 LacI family transcriptional regulator [Sphingobium sp. AEW001]